MTLSMLQCMSHSPLMDYVRPSKDIDFAITQELEAARLAVKEFSPDLVVVFYPDHFNGFFYDHMPVYCIGAQAEAIGDYGTLAGRLQINETFAEEAVQYLLNAGIDMSVSYRMKVDHGIAQPMDILFGALDGIETLPVFINSVAPPFAPMSKIVSMGNVIGRYVKESGRRTLFLASGGLSHDPPLPRLSSAKQEQREMLIAGRNLSPLQRNNRQERVITAGKIFAEQGAEVLGIKDLNPEWDRQLMRSFALGEFSKIGEYDAHDMTRDAGNSSHEVRTWVAAFSALNAYGAYDVTRQYYRAIPEWICGFGLMTAYPK